MNTCNEDVFVYDGDKSYLFVIIGLNSILLLYLLFQMFRLCSIAFSYSNFHIHEAYKFYALTMISVVIMILSRNSQLDYNEVKADETSDINTINGYKIINQIMGVVSVFSNNLMYSLNGFTWLMIALGCDFTVSRESNIETELDNDRSSIERENKNRVRKIIRYIKNISLYLILPLLMMLSVIGTLKQEATWCSITSYSIVASTAFSLLLFTIAVGIFLYKKIKDPTTLKRTKGLLIYLLISMLIRQIYFIVSDIDKKSQFLNEWLTLIYVIACTLVPILCMSLLAEVQLQKQKCALLKSSEVMLFKSTIL